MSDNSFQGEAQDRLDAAGVTAPESGATTTSEDVNTGSSQGEDSQESQEPRVFTQEELDKIVQKERAKAERSIRRELEAAQQQPQRINGGEPPKPEDFPNDPAAFVDALAEFKAEQKLAEREAEKQRSTVDATFEDRVDAAQEKYPDFDEVVRRHPKDGGPAISDAMLEVIKASEIGPDLAYHLGKNPDESRRIWALPELQQARELGKIEAALLTNPPAKKASSAPDPITPVRRGTSTQAYDPADPRSVKVTSDTEWINQRNAQVAKKHS